MYMGWMISKGTGGHGCELDEETLGGELSGQPSQATPVAVLLERLRRGPATVRRQRDAEGGSLLLVRVNPLLQSQQKTVHRAKERHCFAQAAPRPKYRERQNELLRTHKASRVEQLALLHIPPPPLGQRIGPDLQPPAERTAVPRALLPRVVLLPCHQPWEGFPLPDIAERHRLAAVCSGPPGRLGVSRQTPQRSVAKDNGGGGGGGGGRQRGAHQALPAWWRRRTRGTRQGLPASCRDQSSSPPEGTSPNLPSRRPWSAPLPPPVAAALFL